MKYELQLGKHNRGEPYPTVDFSDIEGHDMSWVPSVICTTNEKIVEMLEKQYAKGPKITKGEFLYYRIYKEVEKSTESEE